MGCGMFLFAAVDAQAKLLTENFHPIQITWIRQFGLLLGVAVFLALRGVNVLKTKKPGLQILRGTIAGLSPTLFVTAVAYVALADAVAVSFVAPFMVTLMAGLILREPVGWRRWLAISIGFGGALIVIRPGLGVMHPAVGLVFLAAALFAVRQIISRHITQFDSVGTTIAYTAIASTAVLTIPLPFVWVWPDNARDIALLASVAVMASFGELLVIKALEVAQAVAIAPIQYTLLVWGTLYGIVLFGDFPDAWTSLGAIIIVATGLYTLQRERIAEGKRNAP